MRIDRENYEAVLIDHLDGKLTPEEEAELMRFLPSNPDIAEELEGLHRATLPPAPLRFPHKSTLKKHPHHVAGIDNESEFLCIAELEGDLTSSETSRLRELSESSKSIRHTRTVLAKTRLVPPHGVVYPHKPSIKRKAIIPISWATLRVAMGTAASVAMLLGLYTALNLRQTPSPIAHSQPIATHSSTANAVGNAHGRDIPPNGGSDGEATSSPETREELRHSTNPALPEAAVEKELIPGAIKVLPAKLSFAAQLPPTRLNHRIPAGTEALPHTQPAYGNRKEYTLTHIAKQGLQRVTRSLGVEYRVEKDEDGKLKRLSIESSLLAFSTTKSRNN